MHTHAPCITRDGQSRQMGFIGFKSEEGAAAALAYFNNTFIDTFRIAVEVGMCRGALVLTACSVVMLHIRGTPQQHVGPSLQEDSVGNLQAGSRDNCNCHLPAEPATLAARSSRASTVTRTSHAPGAATPRVSARLPQR